MYKNYARTFHFPLAEKFILPNIRTLKEKRGGGDPGLYSPISSAEKKIKNSGQDYTIFFLLPGCGGREGGPAKKSHH